MKTVLGFLIVSALFAIGTVLVGGVGDSYDIWGISVVNGGMALLAGLAVLGGSVAGLLSWVEVDDATNAGATPVRVYRPVMIGVAVVLFVVAGAIVFGAASETAAADLVVGDCFDAPLTEEVFTVPTVPCNEPHDVEVFAVLSLTDFGAAFPGRQTIDEAADYECFLLFEPYVGAAYEVSILDFFALSPTSSSWDDGDRGVTCVVGRLDGAQMTDSVQGSGL